MIEFYVITYNKWSIGAKDNYTLLLNCDMPLSLIGYGHLKLFHSQRFSPAKNTEISRVTAHEPLKWSKGKSGGWAVIRVQNFGGGGYASLGLGLGVGGYTGHGRLRTRFQ